MTSQAQIPLAEICEIVQGGRHKLSGKDFADRGFPAYGAGGLNGFLPSFEFERDAVVLSSIGARCGKCFHVQGRWSSLANTQIILPDPKRADSRFLWFQLNDEARWPRSGTAQPFIKPSDIKAHQIYLPPIDKQRHIAAVLDQADTLRAKRRAALAQIDETAHAIFNNFFVSSRCQTGDWPQVPVGSIATSIRTGPFGSQLLHSEFISKGVCVLGIDNAVLNRFSWGQRRFITESKYKQLSRYRVYPADVIITIMGTCGKVAVVPDHIELSITTKHLCSISLDRQLCLPDYLHACFLMHPLVLKQLGVSARGAMMPGLNMTLIKETLVPLPPLHLQHEYVEQLRVLKKIREQAEASEEKMGSLFTSLQHRAFTGAL